MLTNEFDEEQSGPRFFQGLFNGCLIELVMGAILLAIIGAVTLAIALVFLSTMGWVL